MINNNSNTTPSQRRWARRFSLQALYQWQLSGNSPEFIESQFINNENVTKVDFNYFKEILYGVPQHHNEIDELIKAHLDRPFVETDPVELTILRVATYELLKRLDVPYRVILNEALELTKNFGATDGHKFVNGILDKIAQKLRAAEFSSRHAK